MNKEHAIYLTSFIKRFEGEKPVYTIQTKPLTMTPHHYGEAINDFLDYLLKNRLTRTDCYDIEEQFEKNYNNESWLNNLNEQHVMQSISLIIRRERFIDGFIITMIENKILPALLNRLKQIYEL